MAGGQPTFAEPIFVGSEVHAEIIGKVLIPFLRGLLSEDANVRDLPIEGHLSVWIKRFRDKPVEFAGIKLGGKRKAVVRLISNLLEFMSRFWDPNKAQKTVELVESYFSSKDLRQLENALAARNCTAPLNFGQAVSRF